MFSFQNSNTLVENPWEKKYVFKRTFFSAQAISLILFSFRTSLRIKWRNMKKQDSNGPIKDLYRRFARFEDLEADSVVDAE